MARPTRKTVDYFPHFCKSGRTVFILESLYGNDGYAFWYKLLETLGESEGHCYDCSTTSNWAFLIARARVSDERAREIIATLVELDKIDAELWNEHSIIWVSRFVENLTDLYRKRSTETPDKPSFRGENSPYCGVSAEKTTSEGEFSAHLSSKESKVKESKEKERALHAHACEEVVAAWNEILGDRLQVVTKLTDERRKKIRLRLGELSKDADDAVRQMRALFERVGQSSFLLGANSSGWVASFDWLLGSSANVVKVLEGNYDNNRSAKAAHATTTTAQGVTLGVDERIDPTTGRRTYGSGLATIPTDAPARPSARHQWDASSKAWILI